MFVQPTEEKYQQITISKGAYRGEAILYRADIANELNIDPEKTFICLHHFDQLFAQFDLKKTQTV